MTKRKEEKEHSVGAGVHVERLRDAQQGQDQQMAAARPPEIHRPASGERGLHDTTYMRNLLGWLRPGWLKIP